jgi:hypothetical protein
MDHCACFWTVFVNDRVRVDDLGVCRVDFAFEEPAFQIDQRPNSRVSDCRMSS